MAGKTWQPSHEPPHRKGEQVPVTLSRQWKEGGNGWGKNCLDEELPLLATLQAHTQRNASNTEHKGIPMHALMRKPLTTSKHWRFVVNSIKSHFTAYNSFKSLLQSNDLL